MTSILGVFSPFQSPLWLLTDSSPKLLPLSSQPTSCHPGPTPPGLAWFIFYFIGFPLDKIPRPKPDWALLPTCCSNPLGLSFLICTTGCWQGKHGTFLSFSPSSNSHVSFRATQRHSPARKLSWISPASKVPFRSSLNYRQLLTLKLVLTTLNFFWM